MVRRAVQAPVGEGRPDAHWSWGGAPINWFVEENPATARTGAALLPTPGTRLFVDLDDTLVLGMHAFQGQLFVATRTALWRVTGPQEAEKIREVVFSGKVTFADNGEQMVLVDGFRGFKWEQVDPIDGGAFAGPGGKFYALTELSGEGWQPAQQVAFFDGYFIFNASRSRRGEFFWSRINSVEIDPLDFATAEKQPDELLAILPVRDELWFFGKRTVEGWYNSGGADLPFSRIDGAVIEHGIASSDAAASADNTVFWLSNDGIVYAARGYQPQRISTHSVENQFADEDLSSAEAFAYYDEGHVFVQFTVGALTLVYDATTGQWHQRKHRVHGRHQASAYAFAFGVHLIGDAFDGRVLIWHRCFGTDVDERITRELIFTPLHANRKRTFFHSLEVLAEPVDTVCPQSVTELLPPVLPDAEFVFLLDVTEGQTCGPN